MFCIKCGIEKSKGDFCSGCGDKFAITCIDCGAVFPYDKRAKYCFHCGYIIAKSNKKTSVKETVAKQYKVLLEKIIQYVTDAQRWVSYQELSELLGLKNYLDLLNKEDEKSTVGQIIYRADIRSLGYETIAYKIQNMAGVQKTIRFIKSKEVAALDPDIRVISSTALKSYPNFVDCEIVSTNRLG